MSPCKFRFAVTDSGNTCCQPKIPCVGCPSGAPPAIRLTISGLVFGGDPNYDMGVCCSLNDVLTLPFRAEYGGWCLYRLWRNFSYDCVSCDDILAGSAAARNDYIDVWLKSTEIRVYYTGSYTTYMLWSKTLTDPCASLSGLSLDHVEPCSINCDASAASCIASAVYDEDVVDEVCYRLPCMACGDDCDDRDSPSVPGEWLIEYDLVDNSDGSRSAKSIVLCRNGPCEWSIMAWGEGNRVRVMDMGDGSPIILQVYMTCRTSGGGIGVDLFESSSPGVCSEVSGLSIPRVWTTYCYYNVENCVLTAL